MKRVLLVLGLVLAVGQAQAAPRLSTEIWPKERYNLDYCETIAQKYGLERAWVPAGGTTLRMDVRSRELMRRFGVTQPGWPEFIAVEGELVYGRPDGEDAEYRYFSAWYFARADCRNRVSGRLKFQKQKVVKVPLPGKPELPVVAEIGSKVYVFSRAMTVVEHWVEAIPPPEQKLLISLAPAHDQKAEFRYGETKFSPQNAVIGLLPRARLSATGGSGGNSSAASSSAASSAAASNSGGELAPPPANAPVDAAGAGNTAPPGPSAN